MDRGIVLAGGGALLHGLDERLRHETHMPMHLAESPLTCVAVGSGRSLEEFEAIHRTQKGAPAGGRNYRNTARITGAASALPKLRVLVPRNRSVRVAVRIAWSAQQPAGASSQVPSGSGAGASWPPSSRSLLCCSDRLLPRVLRRGLPPLHGTRSQALPAPLRGRRRAGRPAVPRRRRLVGGLIEAKRRQREAPSGGSTRASGSSIGNRRRRRTTSSRPCSSSSTGRSFRTASGRRDARVRDAPTRVRPAVVIEAGSRRRPATTTCRRHRRRPRRPGDEGRRFDRTGDAPDRRDQRRLGWSS